MHSSRSHGYKSFNYTLKIQAVGNVILNRENHKVLYYIIIRLEKWSMRQFQVIAVFLITHKSNYLLPWNQLDLDFQTHWKHLEYFRGWFLARFDHNDATKIYLHTHKWKRQTFYKPI